MAPIELAYFCHKKDEELVRVADTRLIPIGIKTFRDGGAKRGLTGQITSEDGQDATEDLRRLFVLEWPERSTFDSFYQSSPHFDLEKATTPLLESPAKIKLYETAGGATDLFKGEAEAALWSLEIIEVKPKDADMSEEAAQDIFQKVAEWSEGGSGSGADAAACGVSLNLETKEIVVIRTLFSQEPAEVGDCSRYPALAEIAEVALMKWMVAQVGLMPL